MGSMLPRTPENTWSKVISLLVSTVICWALGFLADVSVVKRNENLTPGFAQGVLPFTGCREKQGIQTIVIGVPLLSSPELMLVKI